MRIRACLQVVSMVAAVGCGRVSVVGEGRAPQSWSQYGADLRNSQNNPAETALKADNIAGLHEHWRLRVAGGATSTPVVYDGAAYFGAWNGHFYALDAQDGSLRWDRRLTSIMIRSSALVTDELVYVGAGASLFALDRKTGDTVFEAAVDSHPETGIDASPKLIDGLVVVGVMHYENAEEKADYTSIGALVAFDADSGEELWRVPTSGDIPGPCMGGAGSSIWSTAAIDPELGLLFVGTGQSFEAPASNCSDSLIAIHYARNYAGDRVAWKQAYTQADIYSLGKNQMGPDADVGASPNLFEANARALVGAGDKGGSYRVFDRRTGDMIWRKDLATGEPPLRSAVGGVMTTAAVSDKTLFVASNQCAGTSWILKDTNSAADTGVLYALDTATGEERWHVDLSAPVIGALTIANGVLFQPQIDGNLYARELATGKELWKLELGPSLGSAPSVVDGRLYISAGFVMNGAQAQQGFIAGYGLADRPSVVRDAPKDQLATLDAEQCKAALNPAFVPTEACGDCLCECDATAAGSCDSCFSLAPCALMSCASSEPGEDTRSCLRDACGAKLLPAFLFDRAVEVTPRLVRRATPCGL